MAVRLPPYFDALIAARQAGQVGRHVHLGYWDSDTEPGGFEAAQARLTEQIVGMAGLAPGQSVLDVACGFGGLLAAIDARFAHMRLTGLNIDARQLALCRNAASGVMLVAGDACALPFPSGCFDRVFCVEAMFHFASRQTFLAEAARVLRPGGVLVVSDIVLAQPVSAPWDVDAIERIVRRDYGPWPALWVEVSDIVAWAEASGFDVAEVRDWTAATLPSYRFVAPDSETAASAGVLFRWLHRAGWLGYPALSLRKR